MSKQLLLLGLMVMPICYGTQKETTLNNVFHHQGPFADRIDLTFSTKPICNLLPYEKNAASPQLVFLLPLTSIKNDESKAAIEQLATVTNKPYQCTIEEITKPIKGLKCSISYDPTTVGFEYESYMQQGITFTFIHKEQLKKLQDEQYHPIHRLAHNAHQPNIIIDVGHGNHDKGAINQQLGIEEKDINRAIGLKVAALLRQKGYQHVFLTRTHDTFVPLNERTTMANNKHADLFVSIHANSAPNPHASGIETYSYPAAGDSNPQRFHLSAQESRNYDAYMQNRIEYSKLFAHHIQQHLLAQAQKMQPDVRDRGTKTAPFQVLAGTHMTSVLAELGFISNPNEGALLMQEPYQKRLAWGICKGVISFVETLKGMRATDQAITGLANVQAS